MSTVDVTRESIDAEICSLYQTIIDLKTRRNTLSDLSGLSPEIIAMIFDSLRLYIWNWYTVTHVCRHWRQIALDFPRLWSIINLAHINEAKEFIIRSKSAPIILEIPHRFWTSNKRLLMSDVVDLLVQHAPRIYGIRSLSSFDEKDPLIPLFLVHLPRLQDLTMCNPSASPGYFPFSTLGTCPNLKSLVLKRYLTSWNAENIHSLRELYVDSPGVHGVPSSSELLSILAACPQLERLTLLRAGPKDSADGISRQTVVELPKLKLLTISASHVACNRLFSFLRIPDTALWDIQCAISNSKKAVPITPHSSSAPTRFYSLHVVINHGILEITGTALNASSKPTRGGSALKLNMSRCSEVHWIDGLEMAVEQALWGNTTRLLLKFGNSWEMESCDAQEETWCRLFTLLPDLRYFSIANHFDPEDCSVEESFGIAFMEQPPDVKSPRIYFPKLRELKLLNFNLSTQVGDAMLTLKESLIERWADGAKLKKLVLRNCDGIGPDEMEELLDDLEDVVSDVQLDGIDQEELTEAEDSEDDECSSDSDDGRSSDNSCICDECDSRR